VLLKKLMTNCIDRYYEDLIIGGFQYIKNGVAVVNTIPDMAIDRPYAGNHYLDGNTIVTKRLITSCDGCDDTLKV
jgi:hypothetical protein